MTEARSNERPGTWTLLFDLAGHDTDSDGWANPDWRRAADRYNVVGGDLGACGWQYVAVHTANGDTATDPGVHFGRDHMGRAVKLVPADEGGEDAAPRLSAAQYAQAIREGHDPADAKDWTAMAYRIAAGVERAQAAGRPALAKMTEAIGEGWIPLEHPTWPIPSDNEHGGDAGSLRGIVGVFQ